jgi:hypothetical protein
MWVLQGTTDTSVPPVDESNMIVIWNTAGSNCNISVL